MVCTASNTDELFTRKWCVHLVCATAGLRWFTAFVKHTVSVSNFLGIFWQFYAITTA